MWSHSLPTAPVQIWLHWWGMAVRLEEILQDEWEKGSFPPSQRAVLYAHRQVFRDMPKESQHFIYDANELHWPLLLCVSSRTWWLQSKAAPPRLSRIFLNNITLLSCFPEDFWTSPEQELCYQGSHPYFRTTHCCEGRNLATAERGLGLVLIYPLLVLFAV